MSSLRKPTLADALGYFILLFNRLLTGRGRFGRVRFFALCNFDVGRFDARDGMQSSAKLTTNSVQISPFRMRRPIISGDAILVEFFFKGRQLRTGTVELPLQVIAFHSHLVSIASNRIRVHGSAEKRGGIVARTSATFNAAMAHCT